MMRRISCGGMFGVVFLSAIFLMSGRSVLAAPFTQASIRYDRMKQNSPTSLQIVIVPKTAGTEAKLKLILGSATIGTGLSVTVTNLGTGVTQMPGTLSVARVGTSEIDITGVTDLAVGTTYGVNVSVGVSTPAAGTAKDIIRTTDSGDTTIDETVVASRWITDDQIVITANVPPSFTFVISGNTDAFTVDLSASSVVSTNGRTVQVTTNAAKGWTGWVKSANAALSSVTTSESIGTSGAIDGSPTTCGVGADCYVLDADLTTSGAGSGSLAIDGEYNGGDTNSGGTLSSIFQPFATRTGKTAGDTVTLIARATMIGTKAAASDYTDTLTVVGAGNF